MTKVFRRFVHHAPTGFVWITALILLLLPTTIQGGEAMIGSTQDPSSYSNVDQFAPSHLEMDYAVNFADSTTSGTITHTLTVLEANVTTIYMDVWDAVEVLEAEFRAPSVPGYDQADFAPVDFQITTPNPNIGNALAVTLPVEMAAGTEFYIRFTYQSLPATTALSWMTPVQTATKVHPFVYSLCQLNFCRDWAPMMDTPSQKITYNASVIAPKELVVIMSGNETGRVPYNDTHTLSTFECTQKIPTYQIALVVGDLETRSLTDRIFVLAEAPLIDAAVAEFEDLPFFLETSENYLTPYLWGNYSVIVMPPSFPWGGMEHINANLLSHTLIVGDKSRLGTVVHEATHSWFGNDVGCQNWNHFWINEGINTFMERKVLAAFYGDEYSAIDYFVGNTSMYNAMVGYGLNHSYSSLFPDVGDDDPENSFSRIPYDKGAQFMYYIETLLGLDGMQRMLQAYIHEFTQQAINASQFKSFYEAWVTENFPGNSSEIIELTLFDRWVYEPGLPPVELDFRTTGITDAQSLALEYISLKGTPENYNDFFSYYGSQKIAFVQVLAGNEMVDAELMALIDEDLSLTSSNNPSVKTQWYSLGIRKGYMAVMEPAYIWVGEQGLSGLVPSIYRALIASDNCDTAKVWFTEYESFYNTYVSGAVRRALQACDQTPAPVQPTSPTEPTAPEQPTSFGMMPSGNNFALLVLLVVLAMS